MGIQSLNAGYSHAAPRLSLHLSINAGLFLWRLFSGRQGSSRGLRRAGEALPLKKNFINNYKECFPMRERTKSIYRFVAAPVTVLGLGLPAIVNCGDSGLPGTDDLQCNEFSASANFGADLDVDYRVKALMQGAGHFQALGDAMISDVGTACVNIAKAAGGDESKWNGRTGQELVKAACDEASVSVKAMFMANAAAKAQLLIEGGRCEASFKASADCNAQCDVGGKCTPAQLEAKCEPGKLAGTCSGTCEGSCQAEAGATVDCKGECSARCDGTCTGTCEAMNGATCAGRCNGTCEGKCSGTCEIAAGVMATCSGTCQGSCSVEFEAPHCEGKLTAPECMVDADCSASCSASAQAQAECTPPKVTFELDASASAEFKDFIGVLEVELPKLLIQAQGRGEAAISSVEGLATSAESVVRAAGDLGVKGLACAKAALQASVEASANVSVSVQASASVSASAGAGG
jgi:hypothetical protein